jgi:hypothetical protein
MPRKRSTAPSLEADAPASMAVGSIGSEVTLQLRTAILNPRLREG